ncbi:MAG: 30S ribosomal protein S20 [Deltaproteobacteria bacterium]|nr:30S ribosomal protein S20 [Deltaproteobacteria bacterium]
MANIKSAEKANRQRIRRTARNRAQKGTMRKAIKEVRAAVTAAASNDVKKALPEAIKLIARAGRKGLIKRNTASRLVSRLTVASNAVSGK